MARIVARSTRLRHVQARRCVARRWGACAAGKVVWHGLYTRVAAVAAVTEWRVWRSSLPVAPRVRVRQCGVAWSACVLTLGFVMQSAVTPRAAAGWHVVVLRGRSPRPQRRSERVVVCVGPHPRAQQQAALHARRRGELGSACAQGRIAALQLIPVASGDRSGAHAAFPVRLIIANVDHPVRREAHARAVRQCHCMHQERLHSFSHRWHRIPVCSKLLLQVPARWPEPCFDSLPLVLRSLNLRHAQTTCEPFPLQPSSPLCTLTCSASLTVRQSPCTLRDPPPHCAPASAIPRFCV